MSKEYMPAAPSCHFERQREILDPERARFLPCGHDVAKVQLEMTESKQGETNE